MVMSTKRRACACLFSAIIAVLYVCLGSIMFTFIEKPYQEETMSFRMERAQRLQENINLLRNSINMSLIDDYQSALLNETYQLAFDSMIFELQSRIPWNFFSGVHFCLTAITTVGYGYITPVTQLGRGLSIPYVLIGIPINIFFSAHFGYFIAKGISKLYSLIARLCKKIFCKKETADITDSVDTENYKANVHSNEIELSSENSNSGASNVVENEDTHNGNVEPKQMDYKGLPTSSLGHENGSTSVLQGNENKFQDEVLSEDDKSTGEADVPTWFILTLLVVFCAFVSSVVYNDERGNWTYVDCVYQVVMTFTTVGFGDMTYSSQVCDGFLPVLWRVFHQNVILEIGLIMMAASITLWSDKFKQNLTKARQSIRKSVT